MYQKITNPETGRKVNINSRLGKCIIKNYLRSYQKAGTFNDDSSLFFMSLTGINSFDHAFGIIITSDIEFKGMFASNFYLHTPFLWCDWDSSLKYRAINVVYEKVKHIELFKDKEVFESFSSLWTAILKENINNEIISVPPILYELLFFPLFDDYSILNRMDDSRHKIDINDDIQMRIQSIQWLPATDYILNHNSLLPDKLKIQDKIYDFQSLYKNWLKSRSKNLEEIYYKNDGIKILLTLVFIANIFPQWFNALRRMLNYFSREPQLIRVIITDDKEIQQIIEDDVDTIVRQSSAHNAPVATGKGTAGSELGNLSGDDIEPILVKLLKQKDGILQKLISEPIPNHVLRMLQDRTSNRRCDFSRGTFIPMNTRCSTTISIGRILISLHRANVRDDGVSLEKKENIKKEISKWSETWRNLMYFEIQGETYSNTDFDPEPWNGYGEIPRGLSSRLSVNNCSCINEKISDDGTTICINNDGETIPIDFCSDATNQIDCEDPSGITRNSRDLLKRGRSNILNILRDKKNISELGKKYNLDEDFVNLYEKQRNGNHEKGEYKITIYEFIDKILSKMNNEEFKSNLGFSRYSTIDQYPIDAARKILAKAIDIRKNLKETYLKNENDPEPKKLLREEAKKYGVINDTTLDFRTTDSFYNAEDFIDIIVATAEKHINSNNFCVWTDPTPIYRPYTGPPAPPYDSYEDNIPENAFSLHEAPFSAPKMDASNPGNIGFGTINQPLRVARRPKFEIPPMLEMKSKLG